MRKLSEVMLITALSGTFILFTVILSGAQSNVKNLQSIYESGVTITK